MSHSPDARSSTADAALVAKLAGGDERALATLYDRFGAVAYGLAYTITAHAPTAESAVADAFAQLWRDAHLYDARRMSLQGWLTTVVRSAALEARAAAQSLAGSSAREGVVAPLADAPPAAAGWEPPARILAALTAEQRRLVELAFLRGHTREEIARLLQMTEASVAAQLRLAADALRAVLPSAGVGEGGSPASWREARA